LRSLELLVELVEESAPSVGSALDVAELDRGMSVTLLVNAAMPIVVKGVLSSKPPDKIL